MTTRDEDDRFAELACLEAGKCEAENRKGCPPKVGAVAVSKEGELLAKAHRGEAPAGPGDHAEFILFKKKLAKKGEEVRGCTVYTTLEPCVRRGHTKKGTPKTPCFQHLIDFGVKRVVVGMLDPNPDITGRGVLRLRRESIEVSFFPAGWQELVETQNREFTAQYRGLEELYMSEELDRQLQLLVDSIHHLAQWEVAPRYVESAHTGGSDPEKVKENMMFLYRQVAQQKLHHLARAEELAELLGSIGRGSHFYLTQVENLRAFAAEYWERVARPGGLI